MMKPRKTRRARAAVSLTDLVNASRDVLPYFWLGLLVITTLGLMVAGIRQQVRGKRT